MAEDALTRLQLFSTCPPSTAVPQADYTRRVGEVARWSEAAGCRGMLIYTDNSLLDPWLVAQTAIRATSVLNPLVAVQPAYMHPYAVAKIVASLALLERRQVDLNLVAGGFRNDLIALGDGTPHDARYDRIVEYGKIVGALVAGEAVTFGGRYYTVNGLRLRPPVPPALRPGFLVSGSSPAGAAAARVLGATAIKYPKRPGEEDASAAENGMLGARLGIVARADPEEAWRVAWARFPADRRGQIAHRLAMNVSDSHWHRQLSVVDEPADDDDPYWLWPFQNYRTFCPYFVGSYVRVARELAEYLNRGFSTFILDVPASPEELEHTRIAFREALALSTALVADDSGNG